MKKMLMVASVPSMIGQFNMSNLKILLSLGYEVHIACDFNDRSVWNDERIEEFIFEITDLKIHHHQINFSRNPMNLHRMLVSYRELKQLLSKERFDFIHCHTPVASVIGRLVAHIKKVKVIYTAHGFHFYKGAPLKNWLIYYPIERMLSCWTDVMITINQEDYSLAQKQFKMRELFYVPGVGINIDKYRLSKEVRKEKRDGMKCSDDAFVILSIGELCERKNQLVTIEAVARVCRETKMDLQYFIVGQGNMREEYENKISFLKANKNIHLLGFRKDIAELCSAADLFLFPSLQEGLPVALMEAMASGLPILCSDIRGNRDLINNGEGGYLVKENVVGEYADKIRMFLDNAEMRNKMADINRKNVECYSMEGVQAIMKQIYNGI